MLSLKFKNVVIETLGVNLPPHEITSAQLEDRLAETYQRLGIPFGTLERLSGVSSRYMWDPSVLPSMAATDVVKKVLAESKIKPEDIGALVSCSVTRDYFEPSVASIVHGNVGLPERALTFDISNACIGFSDGLLTLGNLIESGVIKAGIVVSAEATARMIEHNVQYLASRTDVSREEFLKLLPTLTIGSSSVAFILAHKSLAPEGHAIKAIVGRSATQYADLCVGNGDFCMTQEDFRPLMHTESGKLIASAAKTGGKTYEDLKEVLNWQKEDIDHVFCHQVGRQVNDAFYNEMGLEFSKEYTIYKKYGNAVSAALPTALVLGAEDKPLKKGDKVLLTAFGSGLNCRFVAIEW